MPKSSLKARGRSESYSQIPNATEQGNNCADEHRTVLGQCRVKLPAGSACGDPSPVLRSYNSFSQAATENALSRILIGFHFRKSIEEGTQYGRKIGERAATNYLQPVL